MATVARYIARLGLSRLPAMQACLSIVVIKPHEADPNCLEFFRQALAFFDLGRIGREVMTNNCLGGVSRAFRLLAMGWARATSARVHAARRPTARLNASYRSACARVYERHTVLQPFIDPAQRFNLA